MPIHPPPFPVNMIEVVLIDGFPGFKVFRACPVTDRHKTATFEISERKDPHEAERLSKIAGLALGTLEFQLRELRRHCRHIDRAMRDSTPTALFPAGDVVAMTKGGAA